MNFFSASTYRAFPTLEEIDGAIYFVVEDVNDDEEYLRLERSRSSGRLTGITRVGDVLTIQFGATPGVTGWKVKGSSDPAFGFGSELPATITESPPGSGQYTAEVEVRGPARYFVRVED